ncbi:MAG: 16S rRNA (uracil(1498)-N(3))-methyltransferase [gamma proteobacterium symbiont of Phacoides pectinatus]
MNLILLQESDFIAEDRVRLEGRRWRHITEVHRAAPGQSLRVGLLGGAMGTGEVEARGAQWLELRVRLDTPPPPPLPLTLVMALPRPKMLRRCLGMVAEMGIPELYLINSARVEKSFWQSPWLEPQRLIHCLTPGLEQARDTRLPRVQLRRRFRPFVEDELPGLLAHRRGLVAHPGGVPLGADTLGTPISAPSLLCIGPEGGFIPYEVQRLVEAGCSTIDLGRRIYRVETALPLLIGRLFV